MSVWALYFHSFANADFNKATRLSRSPRFRVVNYVCAADREELLYALLFYKRADSFQKPPDTLSCQRERELFKLYRLLTACCGFTAIFLLTPLNTLRS